MKRQRVLCAVALLLAAVTTSGPSRAFAEEAPPLMTEQFDCADAFDLIAMAVMLRCATYAPPPAAQTRIDTARQRLLDQGLATPAEFDGLRIAFCPLMQGTGMLPDPDRLYLDDGLISMSVDGLAEIIAHELQHRVQFSSFGRHGFKCRYVRAMSACGGCQDRRHPLEGEAYLRQDRAREVLLHAPPSLP